MKRINYLLFFSILFLGGSVILSGCKKKTETITPSFTVSATTVQLQGGGEGLQFYAKCTNDDVKMTKVVITDPLSAQTITYNLNGNYYVSNEIFMLEDQNTAYVKESGTWSFNFVGNRTADGSGFAITATVNVSAK
jgi:hypothetical protein